MKVAIYARVSTRDQTCEIQLEELREYVMRRGWVKAEEYVDQGVSGKKASRPALDRLMKAASRREIDCVLVLKLDRFGRSVLHLSNSLHTLDQHGVRFMAISQGIDTDAANSVSRLILNVLSAVAEFEHEIICERTRSGLKAAVAAGKTLGRRPRVFRRDLAVQLREQGHSWRAISKQMGIPVSTILDACTKKATSESPAPALKTRPSTGPSSPARKIDK